jgi:hypothetical protein
MFAPGVFVWAAGVFAYFGVFVWAAGVFVYFGVFASGIWGVQIPYANWGVRGAHEAVSRWS